MYFVLAASRKNDKGITRITTRRENNYLCESRSDAKARCAAIFEGKMAKSFGYVSVKNSSGLASD